MPHEVRMPQLGMTQDSGVIVAWLKAEGDAVAQGDPLIEVETDKATVEVEAQAAGFIAGLRAAEGDDVPVGDVIAVIVSSEAEIADHASSGKPSAPAITEPEPAPEEKAEPPAAATPDIGDVAEPSPAPPTPPAAPATGKVLASPKAKRLALERGIDLTSLRGQGLREPFHARDLDHIATGGHSVLTAEVAGNAMTALLAASTETMGRQLFAAFAAGAWRSLFATDDAGIAIKALDGTVTTIGRADEPIVLTLVDLCDTRLTTYAPAGGGVTLCVARRTDRYDLTLSFAETGLPLPHAAALLDDIAARVEDPIRQLL
ncbi:MAG: biotin/lipoyl-containing protein [Pseudomonadota bacterium]